MTLLTNLNGTNLVSTHSLVPRPNCSAMFQVGKDVHALVRTKLRSITDLMERSKKGKPLDREAARRLISDVGHLATAVIAQLEDGVIRSQKVLDDIDTLLRRANELSSGCESVYDLAASEQSVALLREEIESLLQDSSDEDDPYLLLAGMRNHGCVNCQKYFKRY